MKSVKNIVWLASYPKSGNTWFRAFLTALLSDNNEVNINNLYTKYAISSSWMFEDITGMNASEMYMEEINDLKPEISEFIANQEEKDVYFKIHEQLYSLGNDRNIIPIHKTKTILYFVRNPLDVTVSYAHHDSLPINRVVQRLNEDLVIGGRSKEFFNIPEYLGSWSEHVLSWIDNKAVKDISFEVIRYEDMHLKPIETFSRAVKAIGLSMSKKSIEKAIENSSFNALKQQENIEPFKEKAHGTKNFFRKGKIGSWREALNDEQVSKIIEDHGTVMKKLGYLTKEGDLVF